MSTETQIGPAANSVFAKASGTLRTAGGRRQRERMCLVSRMVKPETELIRFVSGPDRTIVPDIRARLPGRGVWITARRRALDQAVSGNLFARGLKTEVRVPDNLAGQTAELLAAAALGRLGLARKAGQLAVGFTKVAAAIEKGDAGFVLAASDAAEDGRRKIEAVIRRCLGSRPAGGLTIADCWSSEELSLAIGRTNVIHAAVLSGSAGESFKQAVLRLLAFEGRAGEDAGEPQSDV